ncbi:MAG: chemotaxis-specific protein-glutamate methyltransferase CheB [Bacteroidota bacterium]
MMQSAKKILIVDDSKYMQQYLRDLIASDDRFKVSGTAGDPYEAVKMIAREAPDLVTLDIEMPRMSGLTFLKKIMRQHPLPVIIITSQNINQIEAAMEALREGAVEVISKSDITPTDHEGRKNLLEKIWAASNSKITRFTPEKNMDKHIQTNPTLNGGSNKLVLMGASSGGTRTISEIITRLPSGIPPIVVVQHIPEQMSYLFARQLNQTCPFYVKEAENDDMLVKNQVLIAPGNRHLELKQNAYGIKARITQGPPLNHVRPSVDKLFFSALPFASRDITAILLTGMGSDGAQGLLKLKEKGAYTIAQDEKSAVIYGMPKVAKEMGAAKAIMNPNEIVAHLKKFV